MEQKHINTEAVQNCINSLIQEDQTVSLKEVYERMCKSLDNATQNPLVGKPFTPHHPIQAQLHHQLELMRQCAHMQPKVSIHPKFSRHP